MATLSRIPVRYAVSLSVRRLKKQPKRHLGRRGRLVVKAILGNALLGAFEPLSMRIEAGKMNNFGQARYTKAEASAPAR